MSALGDAPPAWNQWTKQAMLYDWEKLLLTTSYSNTIAHSPRCAYIECVQHPRAPPQHN